MYLSAEKIAAMAGEHRVHFVNPAAKRLNKSLLNTVCLWTGEKKITVNYLLRALSQRCDELGLHLHQEEPTASWQLLAYLTHLVTHYRFTGQFKHKV